MSSDIRKVKDMTGLITYFADKLGWKIDIDDFDDIDDIAYDFSAEDIGLKEEAFARIKSLRQLPPLVDGQKWGIFCVEFDSKRFEVTALRKILSGLIPTRRNSAEHAVWRLKDLLFLCFWGEDEERTIGLAYFKENDNGLPQIKMISCAPSVEDFTQIQIFEKRLEQLKWPANYVDYEKWQTDWANAFSTGYRQTIKDSATLTSQLAIEAQSIRNRIIDILEIETPNGYVHLLFEKFKNTLIHDMTEKQFADMYAQTIVYGLFSARCMDSSQDDFSAQEAVECLPNTNPFLKSFMNECLGVQENGKLSFDELEIGNVILLLEHTKTDELILDFNRQTGGGREDPVIHFYEEFLSEYDELQRVQRGVYYTPQPIVSFIVRAVDSIIIDRFGLKDGLATTEKKTIEIQRLSKKKIDGLLRTVTVKSTVPAIQVLDPATGTGTFLRQIILQIFENFKSSNSNLTEEEFSKAWNEYVPAHLLPRLNAFELMMAPYAVAHMKLAMVLRDTGYKFQSDARLQVYLTNSLEQPGNTDGQLTLWSDPLATESIAANAVKKNNGINVIVGNPPYNVSSSNSGDYILDLISTYKRGLEEKKINLDDDYIKFIRIGEMLASEHSPGILAYISNNSFLDGITHREMRRHLLNSFTEIYIVNLHGNARKKEQAPDGSKDENVFDIMQGVSINIFVSKNKSSSQRCRVFNYDLYGSRSEKYQVLNTATLDSLDFTEVYPIEPYFFFVPKDFQSLEQYEKGVSLVELFNLYNSGIQTKRDKVTVAFDKTTIENTISFFQTQEESDIREKYQLPADGRDWTVLKAKQDLCLNNPMIIDYYYRPFDYRFTAYTGVSRGFVGYPRDMVMKHFLHDNVAILSTRSHSANDFSHVIATNCIADIHAVSDQTYVFPLYTYLEDGFNHVSKKINLDLLAVNKLLEHTDYNYDESDQAARKVFAYIYGVLFSKRYRDNNKELLKIDFPKISLPENTTEFLRIAVLGEELLHWHIDMQKDIDALPFEGEDYQISRAFFKDDKVFINKTSYFEGISLEEWQFMIGSYKPIEHWLKDRKKRYMSESDIDSFSKMVVSIRNTLEIMQRIDSN